MTELESPEKIAKDIAKLERNLNQVAHIEFVGKEKEVYGVIITLPKISEKNILNFQWSHC